MIELENYIENLELSEGDDSLRFNPITKKISNLESFEEETAVMNFKSLNSFVAGVSPQGQEDLLNSLLLAQRAATKEFPDDASIIKWYGKYYDVLSNIGWVIENKEFAIFKAASNLFEIEKAILEILGAVVTGNQLAVLMSTIKAFKSLGENDKKFVAFEKNTHSLQKGSFQLGVATEENKALSFTSSSFILNSDKNITKILFFTSGKDSSEFKYCVSKATLNDSVYTKAREIIKQKLGDVSSFVADLEI